MCTGSVGGYRREWGWSREREGFGGEWLPHLEPEGGNHRYVIWLLLLPIFRFWFLLLVPVVVTPRTSVSSTTSLLARLPPASLSTYPPYLPAHPRSSPSPVHSYPWSSEEEWTQESREL